MEYPVCRTEFRLGRLDRRHLFSAKKSCRSESNGIAMPIVSSPISTTLTIDNQPGGVTAPTTISTINTALAWSETSTTNTVLNRRRRSRRSSRFPIAAIHKRMGDDHQ